MKEYSLTNLRELEAEAIHIIREVAAEFENPVMLYSLGKDSAVMLQLAIKAFFPGKPPFPLMHIDTTWKFREMIEFRDRLTRELGLNLIVHIDHDGVRPGVNPFTQRIVDIAHIRLDSDWESEIGWNVGAIWAPTEDWRVGLSHRAEMDIDFGGNANFTQVSTATLSPNLTCWRKSSER